MIKGNRWDDHYALRAKKENWLARSVYKLKEIDKRFKIIRKGGRVLDLGCYPGSWSQYCLKKVGPNGNVTGLDLHQPARLSSPHFRFIRADVLDIEPGRLLAQTGPVQTVLSDMAPETTGIRERDVNRSMELAEKALEIALALLKMKGGFVCKVFEGNGFKLLKKKGSPFFEQVRIIRPSAVRKGSREIYLIGIKRVG
jgi:23S rRNA (uridine2552-2'-O)-methyltransferase